MLNKLYNQYHFSKNLVFYNVYNTAESWVVTQKLANLAGQSTDSIEQIDTLFHTLFTKLERFDFIFQFNDIMILDNEFATYYRKAVTSDNCVQVANLPVPCLNSYAQNLYKYGVRSARASYFINFNKFNSVWTDGNNDTSMLRAQQPLIAEMYNLTQTAYTCVKQPH